MRRATVDDREGVLATVLAAFVADPAWDFMTERDPAVSRAFAEALFDSRVGRGTVWVSDDLLSASLWERRDGEHDLEGAGVWREFRAAVAPRGLGAHRGL